MVISALQAVAQPRPAEVQTIIDAGLEWIASLQREDGSIHQGRLANYVTSASILALTASGDEKWKPVIARARDFLLALQADEGEGYSPDHHYYGGIGYGGDERPDLSNLQMALEALAASGLERDHEAWSKALGFLQRCQNRSESNDTRLTVDGDVIVAGNDGGGSYTPGDSAAGFVTLPDGLKVPRSYGSMSYSLLKGYALAGLPKDDPRMQACFEWLQKNYTLDVNPGFEAAADPSEAYQGLFYYFHVMAQALDLYGVDSLTDASGRSQPWRKQLSGRLIAMQNPIDGSWVNENAARWWEGNPVLATAYGLIVLDIALPATAE
jgi:squalene-hopene/tetraprenyl-beta-curcumene cyclase